MQTFKTTILIASVVALTGCANWYKDYHRCADSYAYQPWDFRCEADNAPTGNDMADRLAALEKERHRLADELAAAQRQSGVLSNRVSDLERQLAASQALAAGLQAGAGDKEKLAANLAAANARIAELERQLADHDSELASLRGELSGEMAKLKEAQRGLLRALRPEIEKGNITIDLNNERLMINLASNYLFGSGQDELKPAGANALKQVGAVLKDFPEYKVTVDGHTDNVAILGELKKKFPTNKELSESRAANAANALTEGGLGAVTTHGYADTKPVEPNTTASGRAKNRRVEVRVTK